MPTYYMNWAAFELPETRVTDRTTHVVEIAHPEHEGITLVVYREDFPAGKKLTELAASRVAEEMARLDGYKVIERIETEWAGAPAIEIASRWRHDGAAIYQRQAHLAVEGSWSYFALNGPFAARGACDAWLERMRTSFRLRSEF